MDSSVKSITGQLLTFLFDCEKCNRFFFDHRSLLNFVLQG